MIAVIDYGMGNLKSVSKALEAAGAQVCVSADPNVLRQAERIVLPGVGAFSEGMRHLEEAGFIQELAEQVRKKKKPFLGICLGMQLLAQRSHELGVHRGLGWIDGEVVLLETGDKRLKVPHVGWNEVSFDKNNPLFSGVKQSASFYFVHSYHFDCRDRQAVIGTCGYGIRFTAAIQKENIFATQFHPEKSQEAGLRLLSNFINYPLGAIDVKNTVNPCPAA